MATTVALIDYGSGNLRSAAKALTFVPQKRSGSRATKSSSRPIPTGLRKPSASCCPVWAHSPIACAGSQLIRGMLAGVARILSLRRGVPFLGICVGMQLLAEWGREHEDCKGLGWIRG